MEGAIGQVHGNYDCHGMLGSVYMVFIIYAAVFWVSAASLSQLRLAPNRPCMSLVIGNEYIHLLCSVTLQEFVYTSVSMYICAQIKQ